MFKGTQKTRSAFGRIVALLMVLVLLWPSQLAANAADDETVTSTIASTTAKTVCKSNKEDSKTDYLRIKNANGDDYVRDVYLVFPLDTLTKEALDTVLVRLYAASVEATFAEYGGLKVYTGSPVQTINYNNVDGLCQEAALVEQNTTLGSGSWLEVDITNAVKEALDADQDSIAVIVKSTQYASSGTNGAEFCAPTANQSSDKHPHLSVVTASAAEKTITELVKVELETVKGEAPALPTQVTAKYSDDTEALVDVVWDADEADYDQPAGTVVTVKGSVEGFDGDAIAEVTVKGSNVLSGTKIYIDQDIYVQKGTDADKTPGTYSNYNQLQLRVKYSDGNQTYTRRIYISADISELTSSEQNVELVLTAAADNGVQGQWNATDVYLLSDPDFEPSAITWNNAPAHETTKYATIVPANQDGKVFRLDVTTAVQQAIENGETRIGFMFENPEPAAENGVDFYSSNEANDVSVRPHLLVGETIYISNIPEVNVSTVLGTAPEMPAAVPVELAAGGEEEQPVVWEEIPESAYAKIGSFTVNGSLKNYIDMPVKATVNVTMSEGYEGKTYYVSNAGSDDNDGLSPENAWATLDKVNSFAGFLPGDKILLKSGDTWTGYLQPKGNGLPDAPITLGSYGEGSRPIINGNGTTYSLYSATVMLVNQEYWIIENLEITNKPVGYEMGDKYTLQYVRAGIYLYTYDQDSLMRGLEVRNCYVHDILSNTDKDAVTNASNKISGGIIALAEYRQPNGTKVAEALQNAAGFDGLNLHNNIVYKAMHEGIRTKVDGVWGSYNKTSKNIRIANNYIEKTLGDGIVVGEAYENIIVENNVVKDAAYVKLNDNYYASVWAHYTDGAVFQYNEVFGTRYGLQDSEAFDADNKCVDTVFQYNYTHDNWGGSVLMMSEQRNTIYRYNISANDGWGSGEEIINDHSTNATSLQSSTMVPNVYNNTFYIDINSGRSLYGSTTGKEFVHFRNNIVLAKDSSKTLQFAKSAVSSNSIIENNLFSHEGLFTSRMPFNTAQLLEKNNLFGDPELLNPQDTVKHDAIGLVKNADDGDNYVALTVSEIEAFLENPIARLREHVSIFTPTNAALVKGKGQPIEDNLTEDIMGNPIADQPSIGAIEVVSTEIPVDKLTATAGDYETDGGASEGPADLVLDGVESTIWHTEWNPAPGTGRDAHWIQLAIDGDYLVDGLRYLPRQSGPNGIITEYKIVVSADGKEWTEVATGTWEADTAWKAAEFETPVYAKYVRLYSLNSEGDQSGNAFASAAEIRLTGFATTAPEPPVCDHTNTEVVNKKDATCTEPGYTGDLVCVDCGEEIAKGEVTEKLAHTPETVAGKEATCTETGLTEGSKCSVCGEELAAQTVIAKLPHTPETVAGKKATCTETGLTEGSKCSVCGEELAAQTEIPAKGHTPEAVAGKEATCTETGLTEGSKCSVCGEVLKEQETTAALGHTWSEWTVVKEATTEEEGMKERTCSVCGEKDTEVIPKLKDEPEQKPEDEPEQKPEDKPEQKPEDKPSAPVTGDTAPIFVWMMVAFAMAVSAVYTVFKKRNR